MPSKNATTEVTSADHELGLERIVFFSDAVMAIAITLLAVDVKVPEIAATMAAAELPARLAELSPRIMSFVISFVVIGIYWMSHHRYFSFIKRFDGGLMVLNLMFLMFIAAMPFVASLLGQYPSLPVGVVAYAADVAAIGISLSALWWYASRSHRLVDESLDARTIRVMNLRAIGAPIIFVVSIPVGLVNPFWGMAVWWISPLLVFAAVRLAMRR
jgi:uncharacterized membrane protein